MEYNTTFTFTHADLAMVKDVLVDGIRFEVFETVFESVVDLPPPGTGEAEEEADAKAAGGKGGKGGKKAADKKKGKGKEEAPPPPRKDLPPVIRSVGSVVLHVPEFLEGGDKVEHTLFLLDEDGNKVIKTLPAAPVEDDEEAEADDADDAPPKEAPPLETVPATLSVALTLPRQTERQAAATPPSPSTEAAAE